VTLVEPERYRLRRFFRRLICLPLLVAALALTLPVVAGSLNKSMVIQGNAQIGSYKLRIDPTLQGAIEVFGTPKIRRERFGCTARWVGQGISMSFYNLGGQDACKPQYGYFRFATITAKGWRTVKGLGIGDTSYKMHALYRRVRWDTQQWAGISFNTQAMFVHGAYSTVQAKIMNGRVVAFRVWYPAGGE